MSNVGKTKENLKKCICTQCPSFVNAAKQNPLMNKTETLPDDLNKLEHMEYMYCAFDKSKIIKERKGCVCFNCRIFKDAKLANGYFCVNSGIK